MARLAKKHSCIVAKMNKGMSNTQAINECGDEAPPVVEKRRSEKRRKNLGPNYRARRARDLW